MPRQNAAENSQSRKRKKKTTGGHHHLRKKSRHGNKIEATNDSQYLKSRVSSLCLYYNIYRQNRQAFPVTYNHSFRGKRGKTPTFWICI